MESSRYRAASAPSNEAGAILPSRRLASKDAFRVDEHAAL